MSNNIAIGIGAGANLTSGQHNIFLGYDAGKSITSENNLLCIGEIKLHITDDEYESLSKILTEIYKRNVWPK